MARLKLIAAPTSEPLTTEIVHSHLRLTESNKLPEEEIEYIDLLAKAARQRIENYLGLSFMEQQWQFSLNAFPGFYGAITEVAEIKLPRGPLKQVDSITYVDWNGIEQALDPSKYMVDDSDSPPRIRPAYGIAWPAFRPQLNAVKILYTCGVDSDEKIAERHKLSILFLIALWYENREAALVDSTSQELPFALRALLWDDVISNWEWPD